MRSSIGILAFIGLGAVAVAFADPSATETATTATAAPTAQASAAAPAQPAAASTPASSATPAAPKVAAPAASTSAAEEERERHFLSEGYRLEMRNGEKMFCRREEVLGSRLGAQKVCASALQLTETERQAKASMDGSVMQHANPTGR